MAAPLSSPERIESLREQLSEYAKKHPGKASQVLQIDIRTCSKSDKEKAIRNLAFRLHELGVEIITRDVLKWVALGHSPRRIIKHISRKKAPSTPPPNAAGNQNKEVKEEGIFIFEMDDM